MATDKGVQPRMFLRAAVTTLAGLLSAGAVWAQQQPAGGETATELPRSGWYIFNASAYTGYMHSALPQPGLNSLLGTVPLGSDMQNGAALSVGWRHFRNRSSVSLTYNPSYYGLVRNSEWSALNHSLSLRATSTFAYKWDAEFAATGTVRSLDGFLFTPSAVSAFVSAPSTAANRAAPTGAALAESPLTAVLYSSRVLNSSLNGSLKYRYSPRLSVHFEASGSRTQPLSSGQPAGASSHGIVQRLTSGSAGAGLSYSLSPKTDLGVEASEGRYQSDLVDAYLTKVSGTVGHRFGMHWSLQGGGGAAEVRPLQVRGPVSQGLQIVAHGSAAYRILSQSFLATVDRTPTSLYGIAGGYTLSTGGAWQWRRPGSAWEVSANLRQQRFRTVTAQNLDGWIGGGSVFRSMTRRSGLQFTYTYMNNSGGYVSGLREMKVHAVQVAVVWRNGTQQ